MKAIRKCLAFVLALLGVIGGALLASAQALTYSYPMPWALIAVFAFSGGFIGWRVGQCLKPKERK
ncbi:MAG: hypothetical protein AAB389_02010 [Patescibacteria group bacterium]